MPQAIVNTIAPAKGVVYVTGATGSGKSTLLAAVIKELAKAPDSHRKILTYEAPIEHVYDSLNTSTASVCRQSEIPHHLPAFAAGVRNALRRKPHAILVGEANHQRRSKSRLNKPSRLYDITHSNGVAETIRRLVGSFSQKERVGRTIHLISSKRCVLPSGSVSYSPWMVNAWFYVNFWSSMKKSVTSISTHVAAPYYAVNLIAQMMKLS